MDHRVMVVRSKNTRKKQKPFFHHVISSLVTVAPHSHTGKRAPHHHTSHGFLLIALLFTGILLFSNLGVLRAYGLTSDGSVNVSVSIYGDPPTEGAVILFPETDTETDHRYIAVTGTCPDQTLVSIYRNGDFAGSTICDADEFSVTIQLVADTNVLQAQNYDGANQPGPTTSQVVITYNPPVPTQLSVNPEVDAEVATTPDHVKKDPTPVIPAPTAPQPSANPCFNLDAKTSSQANGPMISVGCIHRNIYAGETLSLPLLIKGGQAPYALSIDWGDGKQDLLSISDSSERSLEHTYSVSGFHQITLNATDVLGATARTQTVVSINGTEAPITGIEKIVDTAKSVWINAPVPLYVTAVTLVLGFWIGDIFNRFWGKPKLPGSHHKA